jgi:DNA-binding NtrC family response regulator
MSNSTHPAALLVSANEAIRARLESVLQAAGWETYASASVAQLASSVPESWTGVVLTDYRLPDGTWTDVLGFARRQMRPCEVVVSAALADEHLWSEIVCLGGYDVLTLPLEQEDVLRVAGLAWRDATHRAWRSDSANG